MPTQLAKPKQTAFDIANQLEEAADAIRARAKDAYAAGKMTPAQYLEARRRGAELNAEAAFIIVESIGAKLDSVKQAGANVEEAIAEAKVRIEQIQSVKAGLKIVATLVALAAAISSGDVAGVAAATREVIKASKKPKSK